MSEPAPLNLSIGDCMELYDCDFEDCDSETADQVMMVEGLPVAVLCAEHMAEVNDKVKDDSHKISLDVHFHKHTIVSLVEPTTLLGEQYVAGNPLAN